MKNVWIADIINELKEGKMICTETLQEIDYLYLVFREKDLLSKAKWTGSCYSSSNDLSGIVIGFLCPYCNKIFHTQTVRLMKDDKISFVWRKK